MGRIALLGDNMVNVIAAGEVVERPASVLKELLENSIDAGASRITVAIEQGGLELVAVTDDGEGIGGDDLAMAFQRHATSKIAGPGDLERIATMGFRGEALASIASVAQVRAVSRRADSIEAACVEIDCGLMADVRPCSGAVGTSVEVRKLFYRLPARRKFLRTANTEMKHIVEHFNRIALAHCDVDMTLIHNGREVFRLPSGLSPIQRIRTLMGEAAVEDLIELASTEKALTLRALIGRPAAAKGSSKYQYVFLNGRFIRDRFVGHAIQEAYRGMIEPGRYPVAFLWLAMPPDAYDVNVHPMKLEVRFWNTNLVHSQVMGAIREKLMSLDLDVRATLAPMSPETFAGDDDERKERIARAMADFFKSSPAARQPRLDFSSSHGTSAPQPPSHDPETPWESRPADQHAPDETLPPRRRFLQLHDSYIVAEEEDGFVIIDQHALHERIIYEELCRKVGSGRLESQKLLLPETLDVTPAQAEAAETHAPLLEKLGLSIEPFGPRTLAVQAFPIMLEKVPAAEFVHDLLELMADREIALDEERLLHEVLDMAACKAAVKAGQPLADAEIQQLLADRQRIDRSSRCPHGRPTVIKLSMTDLQRQFKRT